jgi:hypothetical protein
VKWNVPRDTGPLVSNGTSVSLRANGKQWKFAPQATDIINLLRDRKGHSVSDLCATCKNTIPKKQLIAFLNAILEQEMLIIETRKTI